MLTKEQLAQKLNGVQYNHESKLIKPLLQEIKEAALLVIYGASDDLVEFGGVWWDEAGAFDGSVLRFNSDGLIQSEGDFVEELSNSLQEIEDEENILVKMQNYCDLWTNASWVKVIIPDDGSNFAYETNLPFATFEVLDEDRLYCVGLVVELPK